MYRERHLSIAQLKPFIRINQERKLKDKLGEQIRTLQQRNEELRTELVEREEWKKTDLEHAKKNEDFSKLELEKMRKTLDEVKNENHKLSQSVIGEQVSKEKIEKHLRGKCVGGIMRGFTNVIFRSIERSRRNASS